MPVKHFKKITDITCKMHPQHVHLVCQSTVSVTIIASLALHVMSPMAEAVGLTVSALFAAWQRDIELRVISNLRRISYELSKDIEEEYKSL